MTKTSKKMYTREEEILNSVSHGIGAVLALAGTVYLIFMASKLSAPWSVASSCIYGISLIAVYSTSTLYHAATNDRLKCFFRIMDHISIFLLIAGTYTPYTLVSLHNAVGWTLFGVVWAAAILGIVLTCIDLERFKKFSLICYIMMGWVVIFAVKPMINTLPSLPLVLLLIGGIFYTVGIVFYVIKKVKYFHSIWHLFTLAGSAFHYFSILIAIT